METHNDESFGIYPEAQPDLFYDGEMKDKKYHGRGQLKNKLYHPLQINNIENNCIS